ncbi:hypothetical protein AB0I00_20770 [Streptomyces sp. NPDC050803]|uniref:Rv1733c family protein n=1 Tax=unclassified Streptomyces TaxID=2593676 RepID=UPI003440E30F
MTRTRKRWLWRWRRNALRRRSDRAEAWIVLATWVLALLGGLAAAQATGAAVADGLAERRARAHPVSAVLTEDAPKTPVTTGEGLTDSTVWAKVRWTDADGVTHTGRARTEPGSAAGSTATVWTDAAGTLVAPPPSTLDLRWQPVLVGASVGLIAAGTAVGCGRLARICLDRRRLRDWETEWARIGPQWHNRTNG